MGWLCECDCGTAEFLSIKPALETCMLLMLVPDVGHTERVRLYMSRQWRCAVFAVQTSEEAGWVPIWGHGCLSGDILRECLTN